MKFTSIAFLLFLVAVTASAQPASGRRLDTTGSIIIIGTEPNGIAWDGESLWFSSVAGSDTSFRNDLVAIDRSGAIRNRVDLPETYRTQMSGLSWDGEALLVVREQIAKIDRITRAGEIRATHRTPEDLKQIRNGDPQSWGIAADGDRWFLSIYNDSASVYELDPMTAGVRRRIPMPTATVLGLAMAGGRLLALDATTRLLYSIHPDSGHVMAIDTLPLRHPLGIAYDGSDLWITAERGPSGNSRAIYRVPFPMGTSRVGEESLPVEMDLSAAQDAKRQRRKDVGPGRRASEKIAATKGRASGSTATRVMVSSVEP